MTTPLKIIWFTVHFKQCHLTPFFYFFLFHTSKSWTCCVIRLLMVQFQNTPAADLDNWGVTFCLSFFFLLNFTILKDTKKSLYPSLCGKEQKVPPCWHVAFENIYIKKKKPICVYPNGVVSSLPCFCKMTVAVNSDLFSHLNTALL